MLYASTFDALGGIIRVVFCFSRLIFFLFFFFLLCFLYPVLNFCSFASLQIAAQFNYNCSVKYSINYSIGQGFMHLPLMLSEDYLSCTLFLSVILFSLVVFFILMFVSGFVFLLLFLKFAIYCSVEI